MGTNSLLSHPDYHQLEESAQAVIAKLRSLGFGGFYAGNEHLDQLDTEADATRSPIHNQLRHVVTRIRMLIAQQEEHWSHSGYHGDILSMHQDIDALDRMIKELGGAVAIFGSARFAPEHPDSQAAEWIASTIVECFPTEDGMAQQIISGAGLGIMRAANKGAMIGRHRFIHQLQSDLENSSLTRDQINFQMDLVREQMQSLGIRIHLPFEQHSNEFLQYNLSFGKFMNRKVALVGGACGRAPSQTAEKAFLHRRSPGFFIMPGGFGTQDEGWEVATLKQCKKMKGDPVIIVVGEENGRQFKSLMEYQLKAGTISPGDLKVMDFARDELEAVRIYAQHHELPPSELLERRMREREVAKYGSRQLQLDFGATT